MEAPNTRWLPCWRRSNAPCRPTTGEIRQGVVVEKRPNEVLVDIGFKSEGVVSGRELERLGETLELLKVGDEVPVFVMREDKDGNLIHSISRALAKRTGNGRKNSCVRRTSSSARSIRSTAVA